MRKVRVGRIERITGNGLRVGLLTVLLLAALVGGLVGAFQWFNYIPPDLVFISDAHAVCTGSIVGRKDNSFLPRHLYLALTSRHCLDGEPATVSRAGSGWQAPATVIERNPAGFILLEFSTFADLQAGSVDGSEPALGTPVTVRVAQQDMDAELTLPGTAVGRLPATQPITYWGGSLIFQVSGIVTGFSGSPILCGNRICGLLQSVLSQTDSIILATSPLEFRQAVLDWQKE